MTFLDMLNKYILQTFGAFLHFGFRSVIKKLGIPLLLSSAVVICAGAEERFDISNGVGRIVRWRTELGSLSGSVTVNGDEVFVGTNTSSTKREHEVDGGRLVCLSAVDGKVRWEHTHPRLPLRIEDVPSFPIASIPSFSNRTIVYISNRGELVALDRKRGDTIWQLDMPKTLHVFKRDPNDVGALSPSPLMVDGIIYCLTGNGSVVENGHAVHVKSPNAPSFIAVNADSGEVVWSRNDPGERISYGQWSRPGIALVDGVQMVLFPGGDGNLYSFNSLKGQLLWATSYRLQKDSLDLVLAPVLVEGESAYLALARDFESSGMERSIKAMDLRHHTIKWNFNDEDFGGAMGSMAMRDGAIYAVGVNGCVVAIDAGTGRLIWKRLLKDQFHGGVLLCDNRVIVSGAEGIYVLSMNTGDVVTSIQCGDAGECTPAASAHSVFVATRHYAWALDRSTLLKSD